MLEMWYDQLMEVWSCAAKCYSEKNNGFLLSLCSWFPRLYNKKIFHIISDSFISLTVKFDNCRLNRSCCRYACG